MYNFNRHFHVFIVGLGNEDVTADSVGPKTIKKIKTNYYWDNIGISIDGVKVSCLEPGFLGKNGIKSSKIVKSVVEEIKPDVIILIDAFLTNDVNHLNATLQIANVGITPGGGLFGVDNEISFESMGIPVITIGVPTALELIKNNKILLVSSSDIDSYIFKISSLIANVLNSIFYD